jgi:hypothetical protein
VTFVLILYFLLGAAPAHAYLDPGTGSLLLYALVGIATTLLFALRNLWYGLKGKALLSRAIAVQGGLPDVVFHSEGGKYWQVFQPVVAALAGQGIACAYVTPDPRDPGLEWSGSGFTAIHPGGDLMTIAHMNRLKAALVVSSTPNLDVYMLKRSRQVRHYAHLFHAPTDVAFYEKFAFDWYDSLLTVGPFQERSVRALERRRGLDEKLLHDTGCTYYDYMLEERRDDARAGDGSLTVLYAPAWGERSSVIRYGTAILDRLAEGGVRTIFRPHPQFYVSHVEIIRDIEKRYAGSPKVEIDTNRTGTESMRRSDVMVTDLSGVLFDYAFLFERPIILAHADAPVGGQEAEDLPGEIWDVQTARRLARCLAEEEIGRVAAIAAEAGAASEAAGSAIRDIRDAELFNFGRAGGAAARNIRAILESIA